MMAKIPPSEATHTLAKLARPGVFVPTSRFDQFIQKPDSLHSHTTPQEIFSIALKGLGYLDPDSNRVLTEEAVRLNRFSTLSVLEARDILTDNAEIVIGYDTLDEAIADRYDRLYDNLLVSGRLFAFGGVATAKVVDIEFYQAS